MGIAEAPAAGRMTEWSVRVVVVEDDDDTMAEAVLVTDTGAQVAAMGRTHRNEHDESAPEIGDEIAVARALRRLADAVLETARTGIERRTGEHPVLVRPR